MQHTYLRYECADNFGLTVSSASSKAPSSNCILALLGNNNNNHDASSSPPPIVLTTAASTCLGWNLKTCANVLKLGHREQLSGGGGTGRALNGDEVVCLDVVVVASSKEEGLEEGAAGDVGAAAKVATGWVDGAVRVFDLLPREVSRLSSSPRGLARSLLHPASVDDDDADEEDFCQREPLVLNGHGQSPVRTVVFDRGDPQKQAAAAAAALSHRLASGGSDGSVVLWDLLAESGVFRLLGHRGAITDITFLHLRGMDGLITSSLDGLVKVWDLDGQCCTQTIASHRGEVWGAACMRLRMDDDNANDDVDADDRWRLLTGGNDGQIRVWSAAPPSRVSQAKEATVQSTSGEQEVVEPNGDTAASSSGMSKDDVCLFMGRLAPPPNVSTSGEKVACIHYHPSGRFVGVLHANSKNVDVYLIRSTEDSNKKRQRRLKRRQEKAKKKADPSKAVKTGGRKRGILDDPVSSDEEQDGTATANPGETLDPERLQASDEFEYLGTVRASHKVKGFAFIPGKFKGHITRIVCALSTNALETHTLIRKRESKDATSAVVVHEKLTTMDMHGHPTGIRAVALSSDDALACTVSKSVTKVWNVSNRSMIQTLSPQVLTSKKSKAACYGLCASFLPGNTHVVVGTREGHLLIIDIAAGEVVSSEESAHDGAIWSVDIRHPVSADSSLAIITGSADKSVKFWDIETDDEDDDESDGGQAGVPVLVHTKTLQMTDDVVALRYSHSLDPTKRMIFVSTLDSTIKVFFEDTLKLFLSLYGHKLPALAVDSSDDDILLASSGADKTVKIWGLDFGDTHRTLHGHEDSITDLRFVKRTHNFFTASKDGTVRYWDGDRFEQIMVLYGHTAEVNSLAVSRTGAFVLSGGMDRQVRVWERTKDIVFLEEERERELENVFDKVNNRNEGTTADILNRNGGDEEDDDGIGQDEPQSEAAVKKSVLSVSSGDRIMEGLEKADQELKDSAAFKKTGTQKQRMPNPLLLGLEPAQYMLWVLKSIKSAELEQSLLVLPLSHLERLLYYLVVLLKSGRGVELCSRVGIFMIKTHQHQIIANKSLAPPLRELRRLIRQRLGEARDMVGYDLAAMRTIARTAAAKKAAFAFEPREQQNIWAGMGIGSDFAAVLEGRGPRDSRKKQ